MKFGIFYELSVPRPFSRANEWLTYHNALEQRRVADNEVRDLLRAVGATAVQPGE